MPTVSNTRKFLSNYIAGRKEVHGTSYCFARVTVNNATTVVVDPIGLPVISDDLGEYEFYTNTSDISALVNNGAAPDGALVGVVVGSRVGLGVNDEDVSVPSGGVEMTVLYRGPATVIEDAIDWAVTDVEGTAAVGAPALTAKQAEFMLQLEKQGIAAVAKATSVAPTYVS